MGAVNDALNRYRGFINDIGKRATNTLFPDDFEYYLVSLELVNSLGVTVDFLSFPIQPESIRETKTELTNIKNSARGITAIKTTKTIPKQIEIKGDFGKNFKFILGRELVNFTSIKISNTQNKESLFSGTTDIKKSLFSRTIKTGYGTIKVLESIIDKSLAIVTGKQRFLILSIGNFNTCKIN